MRHSVAGRNFGRNCGHRKALLRNLVTSLIEHQRIETTVTKAKEIRSIAEKMVTLGVRGDQHARRKVMEYVYTKKAVGILFNDVAPRMKGRPGGYLRMMKTGYRPGDCSEMAILEFVDYVKKEPVAAPATAEVKAA
jgi:large subunit ribosomal protein L17